MTNDKRLLQEQIKRAIEELTEAYNDGELYEYIADCLDINYIVGSDGNYLYCEITLALGGPNIYLNTKNNLVYGAWGNSKEIVAINQNICDEIDDIAEEIYNCF